MRYALSRNMQESIGAYSTKGSMSDWHKLTLRVTTLSGFFVQSFESHIRNRKLYY